MRLQLTNAILNRLEKYTVEPRTPFVNQEIPQKQKWFRELPLKYVLGIANKGLRNILCSPSCRCRRQKSYFTVKYPIKSVAYFSFFLTLAVQFSAVTHSYPTLCNPTHCSMPDLPVHHQPPELAHTHFHLVGDAIQPSNHLILCRSLLLLPSIFRSIRVFSSESVLCIRWLKYWSFSISPLIQQALCKFFLSVSGLNFYFLNIF